MEIDYYLVISPNGLLSHFKASNKWVNRKFEKRVDKPHIFTISKNGLLNDCDDPRPPYSPSLLHVIDGVVMMVWFYASSWACHIFYDYFLLFLPFECY